MEKLFISLLFIFLGLVHLKKVEDFEKSVETALCNAQCLDKIDNSTCDLTTDFTCNCSTALPTISANASWDTVISNPELLCKEKTSVAVRWEAQIPLVFLVDVRIPENEWQRQLETVCSKANLTGLLPDQEYQIRIWGLTENGVLYGPTSNISIRTHPVSEYYELSSPVDLNVDWQVEGDNCTAILQWTRRAEDYACLYHIAVLPLNEGHGVIEDNVGDLNDVFHATVINLSLDTNYTVLLYSQSSDTWKESKPTELKISAPTCLEQYNNNLTKCVPPPPENVTTIGECHQSDSGKNLTCDIKISWAKPEAIPDYYEVLLYTELIMENTTVSGIETSVWFFNLPISPTYYIVVRAWSKAGNSYEIYDSWTPDVPSILSKIKESSWFKIIWVSLGTLLGLVTIGAVIYVRCRLKRLRDNDNVEDSKYYEDEYKEKYASSIDVASTQYYISEKVLNDEWYLKSEDVILDKLLGEGAFGVVHKGFLQAEGGKEKEVAVKMLKGCPSIEEVRQFHQEIEIMKSVGSHPHLVSMVGCCVKKGYLGPCLVVEYCAKGDLQTYLRAVWEQISGVSLSCRYKNMHNAQEDDFQMENDFFNKVYEISDDILEPKDLLSFARQIVLGMEYLSSLRVVHRDLAARNVLMCGNRTVKVADFGLSRDVYQNNVYTKIGSGKLPIKWMAMESLTHQQYTIQSDVWSFGIVLWEIVTLGQNPYATIPTSQLLLLLREGYRMECPQNCSNELYEIMISCWREVPKERPTFSELRTILEKLMEHEIRYINLDIKF